MAGASGHIAHSNTAHGLLNLLDTVTGAPLAVAVYLRQYGAEEPM